MSAIESVCRSCGRPILWATTAAGTAMPLDPTPTPLSNILLNPEGRAVTLKKGQVEPHRRACQLLYSSHSVTCPGAKNHRRARR